MAIFNMSGGGNDSFNKLTIKNSEGTVGMTSSGCPNAVTIPSGKELVGIIIRVLDTYSIANDDDYRLTACTITILKQNDVISTSVLNTNYEETSMYKVDNVDLKKGTFNLYFMSGGGDFKALFTLLLK